MQAAFQKLVCLCCSMQEFQSPREEAESILGTPRLHRHHLHPQERRAVPCVHYWNNYCCAQGCLFSKDHDRLWEGKISLKAQLKVVSSAFWILLFRNSQNWTREEQLPKEKEWKFFTFSCSFAVSICELLSFITVSNSNNNKVSAWSRKRTFHQNPFML